MAGVVQRIRFLQTRVLQMDLESDTPKNCFSCWVSGSLARPWKCVFIRNNAIPVYFKWFHSMSLNLLGVRPFGVFRRRYWHYISSVIQNIETSHQEIDSWPNYSWVWICFFLCGCAGCCFVFCIYLDFSPKLFWFSIQERILSYEDRIWPLEE